MACAVAFCVGEGGRVIVILIELFVAFTGLIAVWFMTTSASDAVVVCLIVLVVIGIVKLFRK